MKLIVGLGNPGDKYEGTRHNIGFDVVDRLCQKNGLAMTDQKFRADFTVWHAASEKVILVKPYTYMNLSGEALLPLMSYYGVAMDEIVVAYDDLDLEPGRIRLRQNGSSGGHNGIKSIINLLGDQQFNRIRIGIGRSKVGRKVVDHVLQRFDIDERIEVDNAIDQAVEALEYWIAGHDFVDTMNQFNGRK